jgi:ATPase family associated with various cellular activities (AAA)
MATLQPLAAGHLGVRMQPLHRALRRAVERQASESARLERPDLTPFCVTDEQVRRLLERTAGAPAPDGAGPVAPAPMTDAEQAVERQLRDRAAADGHTLPLDELAGRLGIGPAEQEALLLCVAPELDRAYERIFAYVLDDLNRRLGCAELLCALSADEADRLARRQLLGPTGVLRRLGLLRPHGEALTELRQELLAAPGVVGFLLGAGGDLAMLAHDPGAVAVPAAQAMPPQVDAGRVRRLGLAVRAGQLELVGVWGTRRAGQHDVVLALAQAARVPLRQVAAEQLGTGAAELAAAVGEALTVAARLGALLWIRTEQLTEDDRRALGAILARSRTPTVLSGTHPWRPTDVLGDRAYGEIDVAGPGYAARKAMWSAALPDLRANQLEDLAARYRMSSDELRAVSSLARTERLVSDNGHQEADGVERAVAAVAHRPTDAFAHALRPRRTAEELVLAAAHRRTVLEVVSAFRAWPRVAETWGFARHSGGGVKVLFTGEPGTGKTLAAEVIAGMLGLVLLKVDVARVVSKWVGETEKNLDAVFEHAEDSQAVLFFDEADALFGKRGEIKHGIDRYANLEIGYLLQRLEQFDGRVILASNLKENLDQAFTRRFHYVVHFPRPGAEERRRIWSLAFPPEAPLAPDVDLPALAHLDMTGASIVGAGRTAALLAADDDSATITMAHVVRGVSRQYQREARLLGPGDLGGYAALLPDGAAGTWP